MQSAKLEYISSTFNFEFLTFNSRPRRAGFTLIELIIVVAIISMLGSFVSFAIISFLGQNNLKNTTEQLASTLKTAQQQSMAGKNNSSWGVRISSGNIILFSGSSYASRNPAFDVTYTVPPTISIPSTDIVFEKITGNTNSSYILAITGQNDSSTVIVNQLGTVDVQ